MRKLNTTEAAYKRALEAYGVSKKDILEFLHSIGGIAEVRQGGFIETVVHLIKEAGCKESDHEIRIQIMKCYPHGGNNTCL